MTSTATNRGYTEVPCTALSLRRRSFGEDGVQLQLSGKFGRKEGEILPDHYFLIQNLYPLWPSRFQDDRWIYTEQVIFELFFTSVLNISILGNIKMTQKLPVFKFLLNCLCCQVHKKERDCLFWYEPIPVGASTQKQVCLCRPSQLPSAKSECMTFACLFASSMY